MKTMRFISLLLGLVLGLSAFTIQAHALPTLPFPTANHLAGPVFIQPFAGLAVVSESGGVGRTEPFFSDLPDGSLASNIVANILGNFLAFDSLGNQVLFTLDNIRGVEVTDLGTGSTFTPAFGGLDFAGNTSLTFMDSLVPFNQVTFLAGDPTFAFTFLSSAPLAYSYVLLTNLSVDSFLLFADVQTGVRIPEPATLLLLGSGLGGLAAAAWRRYRRS